MQTANDDDRVFHHVCDIGIDLSGDRHRRRRRLGKYHIILQSNKKRLRERREIEEMDVTYASDRAAAAANATRMRENWKSRNNRKNDDGEAINRSEQITRKSPPRAGSID